MGMWLHGLDFRDAASVRANAEDPDGCYFIHRHDGDHEAGKECWCDPLILTHPQIRAYQIADLQAVLDAHFAIQ